MTQLLFATNNSHKIKEISQVLDPSLYRIIGLKEAGIDIDVDETGSTLEENALLKVRALVGNGYRNIFSEDTGLEVKALDGAPGVNTARYAGPTRDAQKNMSLLLQNLEGKVSRSAQFRTVIALIFNEMEVLFEGIIEGEISPIPKGNNGFGYDPIFIPKGYEHTFGELGDEIKLPISHRTRAFEKMVAFLNAL